MAGCVLPPPIHDIKINVLPASVLDTARCMHPVIRVKMTKRHLCKIVETFLIYSACVRLAPIANNVPISYKQATQNYVHNYPWTYTNKTQTNLSQYFFTGNKKCQTNIKYLYYIKWPFTPMSPQVIYTNKNQILKLFNYAFELITEQLRWSNAYICAIAGYFKLYK